MAGYVNRRAEEMWKFISKEVDFEGQDVLDVGCGPGDFLRLALKSGARYTYGIDRDMLILIEASQALVDDGWEPGHHFALYNDDVDMLVHGYKINYVAGITMCFSCLPYLFDIGNTLRWIERQTNGTAIIECQYKGDGPYAPEDIANDSDMEMVLKRVWPNARKIGETKLDIRPATRSIWVCSHE